MSRMHYNFHNFLNSNPIAKRGLTALRASFNIEKTVIKKMLTKYKQQPKFIVKQILRLYSR